MNQKAKQPNHHPNHHPNHKPWQDVYSFWFGNFFEDPSQKSQVQFWFGKSDATDSLIQKRFLSYLEAYDQGHLADWQKEPQGCLATIILLDQFPRNIFRNTPQAFGWDKDALAHAKAMVADSSDQQLRPLEAAFAYMPFEHSEVLTDQQQCVQLFEKLVQRSVGEEKNIVEGFFDYAVQHLRVIEQFGRFPHRNQILGRTSTQKEKEFLETPGSSF